ncbi:MAG: TIGR03790 family protein [Acidobacteria bacterium]|nr:TIGR03790 family protein [Acidobacteriota bacterium]
MTNRDVLCSAIGLLALAMVLAAPAETRAQSAENVAVVINDNSPDSVRIGQAYAAARSIPDSNIFRIRTALTENIERAIYTQTIETPLMQAISRARLQDRIHYIVLTKGVPLRIDGTAGRDATVASVDSELTLLYIRLVGNTFKTEAAVVNSYFLGDRDPAEAKPFSHRDHAMYLVSRLDGFTVEDVLALIDRGVSPQKAGKVVLDQRDALVDRTGDTWLELASKRLAAQKYEGEVVLEQTPKPARDVADVLGYFSWGSTDPQNRVRSFGMRFAPGAIAATFVGSDARTFREPPATWVPTGDSLNRTGWYAGSPESLTGDLIRAGVTGAVGYVAQPFLSASVRPQIVFPAYMKGLSVVEAFYLAMPTVSWQAVVIGDPLCAPFRSEPLSRADLEDGLDSVTELPALFSRRRLDMALAVTTGVPEQAVALGLKAESFTARGDMVAARKAVAEALQVAPKFVNALVMAAAMDEAAGQIDAAASGYRQVLELEPDNVLALNNLAFSLAVHRKMPAEGLPFARRAVNAAPSNPSVIDTLAWIQHLLGDDAGAAKLMEQVVKSNTLNPDLRLHAAIIFAGAGQRTQAQTQLTIALKLNPALAKNPEVKQLQSQLAK